MCKKVLWGSQYFSRNLNTTHPDKNFYVAVERNIWNTVKIRSFGTPYLLSWLKETLISYSNIWLDRERYQGTHRSCPIWPLSMRIEFFLVRRNRKFCQTLPPSSTIKLLIISNLTATSKNWSVNLLPKFTVTQIRPAIQRRPRAQSSSTVELGQSWQKFSRLVLSSWW